MALTRYRTIAERFRLDDLRDEYESAVLADQPTILRCLRRRHRDDPEILDLFAAIDAYYGVGEPLLKG